jgi:hypothetical protein
LSSDCVAYFKESDNLDDSQFRPDARLREAPF